MNRPYRLTLALLLIGALSAPAFAYTIYLKDGAQIIAQKAPTFQDGQAIIVLRSGTSTKIAASEIDMERTREANQHELGSAMVLEGGEFTNKPVAAEPVEERRLSDLSRSGRPTATTRAPVSRQQASSDTRTDSAADLVDFPRTPYRDLAVLEAIQGAFRSQGVESAKVFKGTSANRLLIEVETNSEAAVFRSIKVAADALTHIRSNISAEVETFELLLSTSTGSRAGQFVMTTADASLVSSGDLGIPAYFLDRVQF